MGMGTETEGRKQRTYRSLPTAHCRLLSAVSFHDVVGDRCQRLARPGLWKVEQVLLGLTRILVRLIHNPIHGFVFADQVHDGLLVYAAKAILAQHGSY